MKFTYLVGQGYPNFCKMVWIVIIGKCPVIVMSFTYNFLIPVAELSELLSSWLNLHTPVQWAHQTNKKGHLKNGPFWKSKFTKGCAIDWRNSGYVILCSNRPWMLKQSEKVWNRLKLLKQTRNTRLVFRSFLWIWTFENDLDILNENPWYACRILCTTDV